MSRIYEIRDPIHGFIKLDEWERDIINQPAFQRLRRIRQLAWTDMVYPGATHSRFEHSLGVMHVATRLFDALCQQNEPLLTSELNYNNAGLQRQRQLVRLAALLHDIGHGPFSHAAEEILPLNPSINKHYAHEQYSAAIVELALKDVIENHPISLSSGLLDTRSTQYRRARGTGALAKFNGRAWSSDAGGGKVLVQV